MLLVKFPSRERPSKLLSTLEKYVSYANNRPLLKFLITLDSDDSTVTPELVDSIKKMHDQIDVRISKSGSKIIAVNRDMEYAGEYDILLLASDDMIPQIQGYDEIIRKKMNLIYPDGDGVLWFNDGLQQNRLNTLCILGKKYFSRFGYIYHPAYKSLFCDNEFMEVASKLGRQIYIDQVIIRHDHPCSGRAEYDPLYRLNDSFDNEDRQTFVNRKERGYP